nr:MAG TPA: Baseplate structural protein [Caudoviricetes sp.]
MALVNKPDESIFASSAKQGEVDNFPDLLRGWGITFEQTQGIPPMEWFNFLFKRLDEKHAYLMQRGLPEWSATQDYTKGSCVQFDGVSYRALKNSKNNSPNESNSQYWVRWGFALSEIARATLTQYGLTQLYTGYNSQREDLALTPKTAFLLKQLIDSNTRALGNVIPNSKKSSAVNSNSADTVATSAAVKSAYDKGVEAETAADNANKNAEGRVSKSGDTMTGTLSINKSTERYPIGSYTWGVPLSLSGDAMISNGVTGIALNNNGSIHLGGRKNSPEFIATIDSEGIYTGGVMRATGHTAKAYGQGTFANQWTDKKAPYVVHNPNANGENIYYPFIKGLNTNGSDYGTAFSLGYMTPGTINQFGRGVIHLIEDNGAEKMWWFWHDGTLQGADFATNDGKRLTKTHQTNYAYVETTASNNVWGGLRINRNGEYMLVESNSLGGFDFIRRNKDGSNVYALSTPTKNGTLATLEDFGGKLSGNGWTRLPNGLILQWGIANGGWVNFPIAFPNACFSVVGTQGNGSDYEPYVIYNISNTRFYHKGKVEREANGAHWMAIGN